MSDRRPRRAQRVMAAIASLTIGVLTLISVPASNAATASTTLCSSTKYSVCINAGYPDYSYGSKSSTSYWNQYAGHNCTNYVAYRLIQNGMSTTKPWSKSGNAWTWGTYNKSITNSTPALGSIAWWGKSATSPNGHVAYVEYVDSTQIVISEDNYGGSFRWRSIARDTSSSAWPDGFIHFADQATIPVSLPVGWIGKVTNVSYWTDDTATVAASTSDLATGTRIYATTTVRNTGGHTWTTLALGAVTPSDAASTIADATWPSTSTTTGQTQINVEPGETATVGYWVKVPATATPGETITQALKPRSSSVWLTSNTAKVTLTVKKLSTTATLTLSKKLTLKKKTGTVRANFGSTTSGATVVGTVRVTLDGTTVTRTTLTAKDRGKVVVSLNALSRGKHTISFIYAGSSTQKKKTISSTFRVTQR